MTKPNGGDDGEDDSGSRNPFEHDHQGTSTSQEDRGADSNGIDDDEDRPEDVVDDLVEKIVQDDNDDTIHYDVNIDKEDNDDTLLFTRTTSVNIGNTTTTSSIDNVPAEAGNSNIDDQGEDDNDTFSQKNNGADHEPSFVEESASTDNSTAGIYLTEPQQRDTNNDKKKNKIQLENELTGSPEWILSKPAIGREVEGYMSKTRVNRGENISLFYNVNPLNLNTTTEKLEPAANVTIEVFRTGWYGGIGARKVLGPVQVPGIFQTIPTSQKDGLIVCNWKNLYVVETKPSWTTGVLSCEND